MVFDFAEGWEGWEDGMVWWWFCDGMVLGVVVTLLLCSLVRVDGVCGWCVWMVRAVWWCGGVVVRWCVIVR